MKTMKRTSILLCLFLTIAILTAGTVSAFISTSIYHIAVYQYDDKYTYSFAINEFNTTTPIGSNYHWQLGDGTDSVASAPTHTYTSSGAKIVTVSFDSPFGRQQLSTRVYPGV